jgi:hypothetical protein
MFMKGSLLIQRHVVEGLLVCFMLDSFSAYSSTLKMGMTCYPKRRLTSIARGNVLG